MTHVELANGEPDPRYLEYDGDLQASDQRCVHGTFIGSWWGPDYICGLCEMGATVWHPDPRRAIRVSGHYGEWTAERLSWRDSDADSLRVQARVRRTLRLFSRFYDNDGAPVWPTFDVVTLDGGYWDEPSREDES